MYGVGHFILRPIALLILLLFVPTQQYTFTHDCIDQHHKEVQCFVQLVDCDDESIFTSLGNKTQLAPDEAHDIRVESFSKSQANSYQLSVDISWQTPPNNSTKLLKGFFLNIESDDQKARFCFLFNVSESNWTAETISSSPRLHFSTENLFRFGQKYDVDVHSLPESSKSPKVTKKQVVMPHNPRATNFTNLLSPNCSQYSHPYASKWTAGFRRIILHPLARTIQIEFVGAPAQYCFEQYEVRLLDETGLELLHSDIISVEQMQTERIENNTLYFGQYNFTNLDLDRNYIPSVIAVERALDGRCLCPVYGTNPYDNTVVCSCIAADWKTVKLQKIKTSGYVVANSTSPSKSSDSPDPTGWAVYLILVASIIAILTCVAFLLIAAYRHYGARGKTVRIRFIQDRSHQSAAPHPGHDGSQGKALLENAVGETTVLTNSSANLNLLIVYSHDSSEHAAAVLALADFLRDAFGFDVHLDVYDAQKIERNLMDYLSSSIVNADRILIINSMGTTQRYQTKIQNLAGSSFIVEHNEPTPFDSLFVQQIDMVLQHHSIISARFEFSQFNEVMMPLHGCLQYVLPANLAPLVSALTTSNLKNDTRLTGSHPMLQRLVDAVQVQKSIIVSNPQWFAETHHRRRITERPPNVRITQQIVHIPSMPMLTSGDSEETAVEIDNDKTPLMMLENQQTAVDVDEKMTRDLSESFSISHNIAAAASYAGDSGIYDDCRLDGQVLSEDMEAQLGMQNASEESRLVPELAGQTKLSPPNSRIKDKKLREETLDSGMISDADLQMISAT